MVAFTADALAQAIDSLIADHKRYSAGASAAMDIVRGRHNRRAYLDALFNLLGATQQALAVGNDNCRLTRLNFARILTKPLM